MVYSNTNVMCSICIYILWNKYHLVGINFFGTPCMLWFTPTIRRHGELSRILANDHAPCYKLNWLLWVSLTCGIQKLIGKWSTGYVCVPNFGAQKNIEKSVFLFSGYFQFMIVCLMAGAICLWVGELFAAPCNLANTR